MDNRARIIIDWIEKPQGRLGRREIEQLAARLCELPQDARTILIDWASVTHLDFRVLSLLVVKLRALQARGIEVLSDGFDSYLLTILRFSLSEEEYDLFAQCAEGVGQPSAGARVTGTTYNVPHLSPLGISRN